MKTSRLIFIFTVINLICSIIFICYLPISVVFGITGNFYASLYISRWYNLIIPIAQVVCVGIIFLVDIFHRDVPHKYRYLTAWVAVSVTTWFQWVLMLLQMNNFDIGVAMNWPWSIIILFPIGLFMLAEGLDEINRPITEFSIFGFSWIKNDPELWQKTMKMSGTTCIITAISFLVLAVVNELVWRTAWIYLVALAIFVVVYFLFTLLNTYCLKREK